jgi:hypothetical protein
MVVQWLGPHKELRRKRRIPGAGVSALITIPIFPNRVPVEKEGRVSPAANEPPDDTV